MLPQVYYTVDKIGEGKGDSWQGGVGYVTREMATDHIPPPSDDNLILVCGPPPMYKALSGEKAKDKSQGNILPVSNCTCLICEIFCTCTRYIVVRFSKTS